MNRKTMTQKTMLGILLSAEQRAAYRQCAAKANRLESAWARNALDKVAAKEMKTFRPSSDDTGTAGGHNHDAESASTLTGVAADKATVSGKLKTSLKP